MFTSPALMLAVTRGVGEGRRASVCLWEIGMKFWAQQPGTGPKHNKRWRIDMRDQELCPGAALTTAAR